MPIHDVEEYLDEALRSVLRQSWRDWELIVVDDGSTDGGPAIVEAHAAKDQRVRLLRQRNAGAGAARNAGIEVARGEYLVFLDGDDVLPRTGYATMIESLRRSGSDFVLAPVSRLRPNGRLSTPAWNPLVFDRARTATTVEEFPSAVFDVLACNRMFRTDFWRRRARPFTDGAYEDHLPMMSALLRADRFDVITEVCYHWRVRADGSSTTQQKQSLQNLRDRIETKAATWRMVSAEAPPAVQQRWLARVLGFDLYAYVSHALEGELPYRQLVQAGFARYLGLAGADALDHVRVDRKLTAHLVAAGRWDAVDRLRAGLRRWGEPPPAVVRHGRLEVRADVARGAGVRLPAAVCGLSRYEAAATGCLSDLAWRGGRLEVEGWVLIKNLDDRGVAPELTAWLERGPDRVPVQVENLSTPEATVWARDRHARHDRGGFRISLDESALAAAAERGPGCWRLGMRLRHHGLDREPTGWALLPGSRAVRRELPAGRAGTQSARPRFDAESGLVLELEPAAGTAPAPKQRRRGGPRLVDLEVRAEHVTVTVHGAPLTALELRTVRLTGPLVEVPALRTAVAGPDLHRWTFPLGADRFGRRRPLPLGGYTIRFRRGGREQRLSVDPYAELALPFQADAAAHRVAAGITPDGTLKVALHAGLRTDERGEWAQQRLRELPPAPLLSARTAVLFTGTDGAAGRELVTLADELHRRHPGLSVHWEVKDPSADVPVGATPVLNGSRAWHALCTQAAVLCSGRSGDGVEAAPDQRRLLVLTDDAAGATGLRSTARLDAAAWPHVLTATAALADRLRAGGFPGDLRSGALPTPGLPRADGTAAQVRNRVRSSLRLGASRLVLHASADGADLEPLLANLPLADRLLLWSPRRIRLPEHPQLVDVTGWPRPAELLLAADAAVAPDRIEHTGWPAIDPDAPAVWTGLGVRPRRTALPLVPATTLVAALGWTGGPTSVRRARLLTDVLELLTGPQAEHAPLSVPSS